MTQPTNKTGPVAGGVAAVVLAVSALIYASPGLMDFLGIWEEGPKRQLVVYADKLAGGIPTVCKGLTRHVTTTPIIVGERWPEPKCEAEERKVVIALQARLRSCFRLPPPQSVFDAATSHAWNFGPGATCGSAAMRAWNDGNWPLGCRRLAFADSGRRVWSSVKTGRILPNGKPEYRYIQGLANRRDAEYKGCLAGLAQTLTRRTEI